MSVANQFRIDVTSETLVHPSEVPALLPKHKGKKRHVGSVYRWMAQGLRGVRLEYVCIAGTKWTSREAINRFFQRLTDVTCGSEPLIASPSTSKSKKRAATELDREFGGRI